MRPGPRRFAKGPPAGPADRAPAVDLSRAFGLASVGRRDSDVTSLCSSRPSSAGGRPSVVSVLTDRSSQSSALSLVNLYLSSLSAPFTLRPPLPAGRDIVDALRFLLSRLEFPLTNANSDKALEEDLLSLLRALNCPFKLNRSALKAPGTPHSWPSVLSVLHWLTQLARLHDHLTDSPSNPPSSNDLLLYLTQSYSLFLSGDDAAVEELDEEYQSKIQSHAATSAAQVETLEKEAAALESRLSALISSPSRKEELEKERATLMEDVRKFAKALETRAGKQSEMEESLRVLEKELEEKEKEGRRLSEENEELVRQIDAQKVNVHDVERMKWELQNAERDIKDAENGKSLMEEKSWEIDADIARKLEEADVLAEQCNLSVRKLKLGTDFQYAVNEKETTPAEVIGGNYKTTLKPALVALDEDMKKLSVSKLEESVTLQEQSSVNVRNLEERDKQISALLTRIKEIESRLSSIKNEIKDHKSKCENEMEQMKEELRRREDQLTNVEKDAEEYLKKAESKRKDALRETEEETQMCARELLAVIDFVSEYKESMESTIGGVKSDLSETIDFVASLPENSSFDSDSASVSGLKRARSPSLNYLVV